MQRSRIIHIHRLSQAHRTTKTASYDDRTGMNCANASPKNGSTSSGSKASAAPTSSSPPLVPAVEVFGRYSRVRKLTGEDVSVAELLDLVQEMVADYALQSAF